MKETPKFTKGQYETAMKALKNNIYEYKDRKKYSYSLIYIAFTIANLLVIMFTVYDSILNGTNWINGLCLAINSAALIALIKTYKYL